MLKLELTQQELDTIRDALEMRARECREHAAEFSKEAGEVNRRMALTFQNTGDKAAKLLERVEELC